MIVKMEREFSMNLGNVLIFGDSYSTYEGYIPKGYAVYYSGKRENPPDLTDVSETWWYQVITETDATLIQNNSWSGSTISYTGYHGDCSETSSFIRRLNKLADDGFFKENRIDTVFVFGGTNDNWVNVSVGQLQYEGWEKADLYSVLPAVSYFFNRLKEELPDANIVCLINRGLKPEISKGMQSAAEHYGIGCIVLEPFETLNGHPTAKGMTEIKEQILKWLK